MILPLYVSMSDKYLVANCIMHFQNNSRYWMHFLNILLNEAQIQLIFKYLKVFDI